MTPFRRMCLVTLNGAVVGVDTSELNVFTEVIATVLAKEAFTARNTRLNGYAIT